MTFIMMRTAYVFAIMGLLSFTEGFPEMRHHRSASSSSLSSSSSSSLSSSSSSSEGEDMRMAALLAELESMEEGEGSRPHPSFEEEDEAAGRASLPASYYQAYQPAASRQSGVSSRISAIQEWMLESRAEMQEQFTAELEANADRYDDDGVGDGQPGAPGAPSRQGPFRRVLSMLGPQGPSQGLSLLARFQAYHLREMMKLFSLSQADMEEIWSSDVQLIPPPTSAERFVPDQPPTRFTMDTCPYPETQADSPACDANALYRTIDGSCNNLENPLWGRSLRPLSRFLPPDYADGISDPRVSSTGHALPSARLISAYLFEGSDITSPAHTLLTMQFGQFVDHDLGLTAIASLSTDATGVGEEVNVRCGESECETEGPENEACFPIPLSSRDPFFTDQPCLMFVRSQETPDEECKLYARQQLNLNTAYLDASMVYGSTVEQLDRIRDITDSTRGRMAVRENENPHLMPLLPETDEDPECVQTNEEEPCMEAGDERVNEQVGLAAIHTIFVRYHNYIEDGLHYQNPQWSGEKLFQESRRILTAVWQHIIYSEFLPIVLGPEIVQQNQLQIASPSDYPGYDDSVKVDVANVFQTAAFRFGHTLIPTKLGLSRNDFSNEDCIFLSQGFFRPDEIYNNDGPAASGVDNLMLAQATQQPGDGDNRFTPQITRHLFTDNPPFGIGTDLTALNIQRGRDHGIPGYLEWREWCGLSVAHNFNRLYDIPSRSARRTLKYLYRRVEDIDLFAGGVLEQPVSGGLVGPTFACIIARQFNILRRADRFWFERQGVNTALTEDQISEVRRMTLAKVMCLTLDDVDTIQRRVLLQPLTALKHNVGYRYSEFYHYISLYHSDHNERRDCEDLPELDLTRWTEQVYH